MDNWAVISENLVKIIIFAVFMISITVVIKKSVLGNALKASKEWFAGAQDVVKKECKDTNVSYT